MPSSARSCPLCDLVSFPTRRSSDLVVAAAKAGQGAGARRVGRRLADRIACFARLRQRVFRCLKRCREPLRFHVVVRIRQERPHSCRDRKSTRLNSSHANISYAVFCSLLPTLRPSLFPYTTLFRSRRRCGQGGPGCGRAPCGPPPRRSDRLLRAPAPARVPLPEALPGTAALSRCRPHPPGAPALLPRSEEHTSELQSRQYLVCRLLLAPAHSAT